MKAMEATLEDISEIIVPRKEIVWIHGRFSQNFRNYINNSGGGSLLRG